MKKERSIRLNEEYNNKIAAIDSKIKSLIESYNLFNSQFFLQVNLNLNQYYY